MKACTRATALYGTGRIGIKTYGNNWVNYSEITEIPSDMAVSAVSYALERAIGDRGNKVFELSNHLGNVLATVSDKKLGRVLDSTSFVAAYYEGQVQSAQDYYAFGWNIPSRKFNTGSYRHGFNGKENDSDFGEQLIQDYGFRIYNPSIGRFLSVDPLTRDYPSWTPYAFAMNRVIDGVDVDGLEYSRSVYFNEETGVTHIKITLEVDPNWDQSSLTGQYINQKLSSEQQQAVMEGTQQYFSGALDAYDRGNQIFYSGQLIFKEGAIMKLRISAPSPNTDPAFAGMSIPGIAESNTGKWLDGTFVLNDILYIANTAVHELFHQGGPDHPTQPLNGTRDAQLVMDIKGGKVSYKTNEETDPMIMYNIMLYGTATVDDQKVSSVRGKDEEGALYLSLDQIKLLDKNIKAGKINGEPMNDYDLEVPKKQNNWRLMDEDDE